jgi:hypothetical protein
MDEDDSDDEAPALAKGKFEAIPSIQMFKY